MFCLVEKKPFNTSLAEMIGEVVEELLMTVKHVSYIFFIYIFKSKMDSDNLESGMPFDLKEEASVVGEEAR